MNWRAEAIAALEAGRSTAIWRRQLADLDTPIAAALKLFEADRGDFILESVEGGNVRGRYSYIGLAPDLVFRATGDRPAINRNWLNDRDDFVDIPGGSIAALRALAAECRFDMPEGLPSSLACLVGYFGYETVGLVEKLPRPAENPLELPDMMFVRPTLILIFDRLADELHFVAPLWAKDGDESVDKIVDDAVERMEAAAARLAQPYLPRHDFAPSGSNTTDGPELVEGLLSSRDKKEGQGFDTPGPNGSFKPGLSSERYREMVLAAKEYIAAGDIFQVVLAQRFTRPFPLPPVDLYRALRRINPSPFLYYLDLPGFALIGSSPEILVRARNGEVTIRPIAGTRPRGATTSEDAANRESLLADPKERAEHLMLLDLGRNDVGRVAEAGSVTVTDSYTVEMYSHVMHIVSNVVGALSPEYDALDALFAGFPAGTVSGAPKVRACEIIAELEPETRGAYAGGVGYFSPDGSMDSCIVLRTAVVKDGEMHVQAGAGIVADSDPAYEQRECEAKAGALFAAAREAVERADEPGFGQ